MSDKTINISKINAGFGDRNIPEDEYFSELLSKAYKGEIDCYNAVVPISKIVPFSEYEPEIKNEYRKYFVKKFVEDKPLALYVYEKDGHFIMSDDYSAYYLYKEAGSAVAVCVVVGPHNINEGVKYGPAFKLSLPKIEEI